MNGVTAPVSRSTVTIRELLLGPAPPSVCWLESVANRVPPRSPFSNVSPMAGPSGWNVLPPPLGLPIGPPTRLPLLSKIRRSDVNGLVGDDRPPYPGPSLRLHLLGRPEPDSCTTTLKCWRSPTNAT